MIHFSNSSSDIMLRVDSELMELTHIPLVWDLSLIFQSLKKLKKCLEMAK